MPRSNPLPFLRMEWFSLYNGRQWGSAHSGWVLQRNSMIMGTLRKSVTCLSHPWGQQQWSLVGHPPLDSCSLQKYVKSPHVNTHIHSKKTPNIFHTETMNWFVSGLKRMLYFNGHWTNPWNYPVLNVDPRNGSWGDFQERGEVFILELFRTERPGDWHSLSLLSSFLACDCNREGTQKPMCDRDTGMCRCRKGVSGQRCDRCARGHGQEFPACLPCHLCFDHWNHTISSLSRAVQGLIRLAANVEDKRETLPVCEADFKGLRENMSEIERILKHPVFSSGEFLKVKDYHDSVR